MRTYTEQLQELKDNAVNAIIRYADMLGEMDNGTRIKYLTITDNEYKYYLGNGSVLDKVGLVLKGSKGDIASLYSLELPLLLQLADHITETSQVTMRNILDV